jgi:ribosomal protein L7/L12
MNIYNLISGVFCAFVGVLALTRAMRGSGALFYFWAVALWMMAAGVMARMWQLQAAAGAIMVLSVVIDERLAARHYATHRMNLQDDAAKEIRAMPVEDAEATISYEVLMKSTGDRRNDVVTALRSIYVLDAKDAEKLATPGVRPIKQFMSRQEAQYVREKLESAGAQVEVRPM